MNATVEVVCYASKTLKDGTHPLMLRISKDSKKKYISLGISLNQKHWDFNKQQPKPTCPKAECIERLITSRKGQYQDKIIEFSAMGKEYTPQTFADAVENPCICNPLINTVGLILKLFGNVIKEVSLGKKCNIMDT